MSSSRCWLTVVALAVFGVSVADAGDTIHLKSGKIISGTVLRESEKSVIVRLDSHTTMTFERSQVEKVEKGTSPPPSEAHSGRFVGWEKCLQIAADQSWSTHLRAIPAIVIDKGVLRAVPYMSFRADEYEVNIYGDPNSPAGIEIGIHGNLLGDKKAEQDCLSFMEKMLTSKDDRKEIQHLIRSKDLQTRGSLTFEVTPATAEDAYGGWWVSVYDGSLIDKARASDKELAAITEKVSEVKSTKTVAEVSDDESPVWGAVDLSHSRRIAKPKTTTTKRPEPEPEPVRVTRPQVAETHSSGGSVYVRGYYRKDGSYVKPHSRKK